MSTSRMDFLKTLSNLGRSCCDSIARRKADRVSTHHVRTKTTYGAHSFLLSSDHTVFCGLRHTSNGFLRELAIMSFALRLVRAMSATSICCNTNSGSCAPVFAFVSPGINKRSFVVTVISIVWSAAHCNIISDSLITPAKMAPSSSTNVGKSSARGFLRTNKAFHT